MLQCSTEHIKNGVLQCMNLRLSKGRNGLTVHLALGPSIPAMLMEMQSYIDTVVYQGAEINIIKARH